jgi:hypothetical protein
MMSTLKEANKKALLGALIFQSLMFWAAFTGTWALQVDTWQDGLRLLPQTSLLAAAFGVGVFLVQGLLSSDTKAKLVFWKFRGNPYPGAEAFSKWMHKDPRIDRDKINSKHHPLPNDASKQNALWYKLLKENESKNSVQDAHRRYLLARDLATNWIVFGLPSGLAVWWGQSEFWVKVLFDFGTVAVFLVMLWVAKNHGHRLVTSVLAAESSEN